MLLILHGVGVGPEPTPAIARCPQADPPAAVTEPPMTVALSHPDDPYYALAEEIAQSEKLRLLTSLDQALGLEPVFLLWVVSPSHLSDRILSDFGLAMRDQQAAISVGIISGSTLEQARALWQRQVSFTGRRLAAVTREQRLSLGRAAGRKANRGSMWPAAIAGLSLTALHGGYAIFRFDYLTLLYNNWLHTIGESFEINPLFLFSTFLLTGCGAWIFLNSRSGWMKGLAILIPTLPTLFMAVFWFGLVTLINTLARQRLGAPLYGPGRWAMALITWGVQGVLVGIAFMLLSKLDRPARKKLVGGSLDSGVNH